MPKIPIAWEGGENMEENKKINYLMVTSVKNERQTICKSEFPVSVGDLVNVRDQEADVICMVDAS